METPMLILDVLSEIPDPRAYNSQHDLTDVLFVALAAVLCGATHCTEMEVFAEARLDLLRQFVPLQNGAPSHDTFSRVLGALDAAAFNAAFGRFMAAFGEQARIDAPGHVAVDGKSLRRAYEKGRAHMPPLVVTAFACDTFMSLSQVVAEAGGEAAAAIEALKLLSLKGCTVTGDALHCHRRMTRTVRDGGGHYVLAIKGNQARLAKEAPPSTRPPPTPERPSPRPRTSPTAATRSAAPSSPACARPQGPTPFRTSPPWPGWRPGAPKAARPPTRPGPMPCRGA